ncbi:MAG: cytochrome P450, partial [Myxococcales bacterium]|nr:cytochrome P450 [Myxococcales bacterium]
CGDSWLNLVDTRPLATPKPCAPEPLLIVLAYCYLQGVYHSFDVIRRLEVDPELASLRTRVAPSPETIRRFRREHRTAVTDCLTHALVALSQQPEARVHDDEAVLRETLRRYPVNSSITRRARAPVALGDQALAAGDSLAVVPEEVNRHGWPEPDRFDPGRFSAKSPAGYSFAFGAGPRACPAQRFSLTLLGELLATYRRLGVEVPRRHPHHRSLAVPIPAMIGGGACAAQPLHERLQHRARYLACAAATYPLAALHRHP